MSGPFLVIFAVLVVGGWAVWMLLRSSRERASVQKELRDPRHNTLAYAVPEWQDPAVVLAALENTRASSLEHGTTWALGTCSSSTSGDSGSTVAASTASFGLSCGLTRDLGTNAR